MLTPNADGSWTDSVLHSFNADRKDGYKPYASLIFDSAGSLYGTTWEGGSYNGGTIFQLTSSRDGHWTEKVLHAINTGKDGANPVGGLVFDDEGNLYGTTPYNGDYGYGTVFRLHRSVKGYWKETTPHSFRNHPGAMPFSGLIFDGHGDLYGTTGGDAAETWGSVFEITLTYSAPGRSRPRGRAMR